MSATDRMRSDFYAFFGRGREVRVTVSGEGVVRWLERHGRMTAARSPRFGNLGLVHASLTGDDFRGRVEFALLDAHDEPHNLAAMRRAVDALADLPDSSSLLDRADIDVQFVEARR